MENLKNDSSQVMKLLLVGAVVILIMKLIAAWLTNSIAVLSDAAESVVNIATATVAGLAVWWARLPPDDDHPYGHDKAEYFAVGFVGSVVLLASISIAVTAVDRLLSPVMVEQTWDGLLLLVPAALANGALGLYASRRGRADRSPTLTAEGRHLLLDVLTTGVAILALVLTDWLKIPWLDPLAGLALAIFILATGIDITRRSLHGLMDVAWPTEELSALGTLLTELSEKHEFGFHALRTRQAASRRFVSMHVLVPGQMTVQEGHELLEIIEKEVRDSFPGTSILTHLEPLEDPCSFADQNLFREA